MNEYNIGLRQEQLRDLQEYVKDIDNDITLMLQSLQWDRKHLLQGEQMVTCKFDSNHRILADKVKEHEEKCYIKSQNYVPGDLFFPEPLDANAATVVKLSAENINDIINYAVKTDPSFRRRSDSGGPGHAPLTLGGLQAAYSADERRALYDAVAAAAPPTASRDPLDRDLATDAPATTSAPGEHRSDALLALRDARRRRARHRGVARDGYQHELRGLISAQMELFTGKWNDEDADTKPDVTIDESDDGRRYGHVSDRRDHVRNNGGSKYIYGENGREHIEIREDKRKDYVRENKKREYEREHRKDKKREYEKDSRDDKRREYERDSRKDKRREHEYDKKYKEKDKLHDHDHRRRQPQYDKVYIEIKQEEDDYSSDRRKRKERRYDREQETDRSSFRDTKKYHKQKSAERRRDRSRGREYNRNYTSNIGSFYLKIKKEPSDYD